MSSAACVDTLALAALSQVIRCEAPPAVEELRMEMERARMKAEDLSAAQFSTYGAKLHTSDPSCRLTWRELAEHRVEMCEELLQKIDETHDILRAAHASTAGTDGDVSRMPSVALQNARAAMKDAQRTLHSDSESSEAEGGEDSDRGERVAFCEACDGHFRFGTRTVAWYATPFHYDGRNLYSACARCRSRLGLLQRPVEWWA